MSDLYRGDILRVEEAFTWTRPHNPRLCVRASAIYWHGDAKTTAESLREIIREAGEALNEVLFWEHERICDEHESEQS